MINNLSYSQVLEISKSIKEQINIVSNLVENLGVQELNDFVSTVEGYTKYLETVVKLNQDADNAIKDIIK